MDNSPAARDADEQKLMLTILEVVRDWYGTIEFLWLLDEYLPALVKAERQQKRLLPDPSRSWRKWLKHTERRINQDTPGAPTRFALERADREQGHFEIMYSFGWQSDGNGPDEVGDDNQGQTDEEGEDDMTDEADVDPASLGLPFEELQEALGYGARIVAMEREMRQMDRRNDREQDDMASSFLESRQEDLSQGMERLRGDLAQARQSFAVYQQRVRELEGENEELRATMREMQENPLRGVLPKTEQEQAQEAKELERSLASQVEEALAGLSDEMGRVETENKRETAKDKRLIDESRLEEEGTEDDMVEYLFANLYQYALATLTGIYEVVAPGPEPPRPRPFPVTGSLRAWRTEVKRAIQAQEGGPSGGTIGLRLGGLGLLGAGLFGGALLGLALPRRWYRWGGRLRRRRRCRNCRRGLGRRRWLLRCSRCQSTIYCSEACQRQDWTEGQHARVCRAAPAAGASVRA